MGPLYGGGYGIFGQSSNLGLYGALVAYGTLELTETSPAQTFTEPLTTDQMRGYLRLPVTPVDYSEEDLLSTMITAAREQAEILQNRDLVRKQFDQHHDYWPAYRIELRGPLASVDLIQYKDSMGALHSFTAGTDYVVDTSKQPGVITPPWNMTWPTFNPWPTSALLVRYTSGYSPTSAFWSDSGARVKLGMKMLVAEWFSERLPFQRGAVGELPYAVTSCMEFGAIRRAR